MNTLTQKSIISLAASLEATINISVQLLIYKIATKYIKTNSGGTDTQRDWFSAGNETGSGASNLFSSTVRFEYIFCVVSAIFSDSRKCYLLFR
jgi:hypothetical protein